MRKKMIRIGTQLCSNWWSFLKGLVGHVSNVPERASSQPDVGLQPPKRWFLLVKTIRRAELSVLAHAKRSGVSSGLSLAK